MSRNHRRRHGPLTNEGSGLNIVITPPSDEKALALIKNKEAIINAAIKAEAANERDPAFESLCREAIERGDYTPLADVIDEVRDEVRDERRRNLIRDTIEATKAAQQRNAERLVRERAYFLWEDAGYPDGRDQEFWFEAERQFRTWVRTLTFQDALPADRRAMREGAVKRVV